MRAGSSTCELQVQGSRTGVPSKDEQMRPNSGSSTRRIAGVKSERSTGPGSPYLSSSSSSPYGSYEMIGGRRPASASSAPGGGSSATTPSSIPGALERSKAAASGASAAVQEAHQRLERLLSPQAGSHGSTARRPISAPMMTSPIGSTTAATASSAASTAAAAAAAAAAGHAARPVSASISTPSRGLHGPAGTSTFPGGHFTSSSSAAGAAGASGGVPGHRPLGRSVPGAEGGGLLAAMGVGVGRNTTGSGSSSSGGRARPASPSLGRSSVPGASGGGSGGMLGHTAGGARGAALSKAAIDAGRHLVNMLDATAVPASPCRAGTPPGSSATATAVGATSSSDRAHGAGASGGSGGGSSGTSRGLAAPAATGSTGQAAPGSSSGTAGAVGGSKQVRRRPLSGGDRSVASAEATPEGPAPPTSPLSPRDAAGAAGRSVSSSVDSGISRRNADAAAAVYGCSGGLARPQSAHRPSSSKGGRSSSSSSSPTAAASPGSGGSSSGVSAERSQSGSRTLQTSSSSAAATGATGQRPTSASSGHSAAATASAAGSSGGSSSSTTTSKSAAVGSVTRPKSAGRLRRPSSAESAATGSAGSKESLPGSRLSVPDSSHSLLGALEARGSGSSGLNATHPTIAQRRQAAHAAQAAASDSAAIAAASTAAAAASAASGQPLEAAAAATAAATVSGAATATSPTGTGHVRPKPPHIDLSLLSSAVSSDEATPNVIRPARIRVSSPPAAASARSRSPTAADGRMQVFAATMEGTPLLLPTRSPMQSPRIMLGIPRRLRGGGSGSWNAGGGGGAGLPGPSWWPRNPPLPELVSEPAGPAPGSESAALADELLSASHDVLAMVGGDSTWFLESLRERYVEAYRSGRKMQQIY